MAYKIGESDLKEVMAHLDHREKDGYQRTPVMFHPQDTDVKPWELTIYLGKKPLLSSFYFFCIVGVSCLVPSDTLDVSFQSSLSF